MERPTIDRIWAAVLAAFTYVTLITTSIEIDLWYINDTAAHLFTLAYITSVAAIVVDPDQVNFHRVASVAGSIFWYGRAFAALQILIDGGSRAHWTVVANAVIIGCLAYSLHLTSVRAIAARRVMAGNNVRR